MRIWDIVYLFISFCIYDKLYVYILIFINIFVLNLFIYQNIKKFKNFVVKCIQYVRVMLYLAFGLIIICKFLNEYFILFYINVYCLWLIQDIVGKKIFKISKFGSGNRVFSGQKSFKGGKVEKGRFILFKGQFGRFIFI